MARGAIDLILLDDGDHARQRSAFSGVDAQNQDAFVFRIVGLGRAARLAARSGYYFKSAFLQLCL